MSDLVESGRLVEAILFFTVLEGIVLAAYHRLTGRGIAAADLVFYLLSGMGLVGALREALVGAWWGWIAACLAGALTAHLLEIRRRWNAQPHV